MATGWHEEAQHNTSVWDPVRMAVLQHKAMQGWGGAALGCSSPASGNESTPLTRWRLWKSWTICVILWFCDIRGEYALLTGLHRCQGRGSSALQICRKATLLPTTWHHLSQFCYANKAQRNDSSWYSQPFLLLWYATFNLHQLPKMILLMLLTLLSVPGHQFILPSSHCCSLHSYPLSDGASFKIKKQINV